MKNCFYLHIPKTGGTTFAKNFHFSVSNFTKLDRPEAISSGNGQLIHMHLPDPSLEVFCERYGLDFDRIIKD